MAITWANILEWETGPLDEIAQTLFEASQGLREAYEKGKAALSAVRSEGEAVTAMHATTLTNLASLERALINVNGTLMAIEGARDGVGDVLAQVNDVLADAATKQCEIEADGSVHPMTSAPNTDLIRLVVSALAIRVAKIVEYADQVDTDLSHALADMNNDRYTDGDGADNKVVSVPDLPQPNWSPSQNAAWWKSLSYEQQQFLINRRQDDIRHFDGLPAETRDKANMHALDGYLHADGTYRVGAFEESKAELSSAMEEYDKAKKEYFKAAALTAPGTIDRLILTDSPGSGVQSIDEYNVPQGTRLRLSCPPGRCSRRLGLRLLLRKGSPRTRWNHSPQRRRHRCQRLLTPAPHRCRSRDSRER